MVASLLVVVAVVCLVLFLFCLFVLGLFVLGSFPCLLDTIIFLLGPTVHRLTQFEFTCSIGNETIVVAVGWLVGWLVGKLVGRLGDF